jgi:hypothetical protein
MCPGRFRELIALEALDNRGMGRRVIHVFWPDAKKLCENHDRLPRERVGTQASVSAVARFSLEVMRWQMPVI